MKLCSYERYLSDSASSGKNRVDIYTLFTEKSFARSECNECFTHQLKHVAPSACDLLSVLWTDYISCTPSDHLYIPRRIVFTHARASKIQEGEMRKKVFPANRGRDKFVGEVNPTAWGPIPVCRRQWGESDPGTRYALTQILDPLRCRGCLTVRTKDEAIIGPSERKEEKKKKYRSFDSHREKKRVRATLSAHARANVRARTQGRKGERSPLRFSPSSSLYHRPRPFSIAFCNYSRVYDLVCAPRSVNRATRGPRPIECGTRWCGDDTDDTQGILSHISLTFYHNSLITIFSISIYTSFLCVIIANLSDELLSSFLPHCYKFIYLIFVYLLLSIKRKFQLRRFLLCTFIITGYYYHFIFLYLYSHKYMCVRFPSR